MVTRTITTTKATFLCLDVQNAEPNNKTVTLPGTFKSDDVLLKKASEIINDENNKVVHLVDKVIESEIYGMSETDFLKYATVQPPRNNKIKAENDGN